MGNIQLNKRHGREEKGCAVESDVSARSEPGLGDWASDLVVRCVR